MAETLPDAPERIPAAFATAWNARDPDAIAALFDTDAEFVNVVGLWWHDRAAIRRAHAYGLTRIFQNSTLRVGAVRVKHLREDVAVVHARMYLEGQTPVGAAPAPGARANIFTFVAHRTAEGWQCAAAQNTDVVPGAETNAVDAALLTLRLQAVLGDVIVGHDIVEEHGQILDAVGYAVSAVYPGLEEVVVWANWLDSEAWRVVALDQRDHGEIALTLLLRR